MKQITLLVITLVALSSCASPFVPNVKDSIALENNQGILVANIASNYNDFRISIKNKKNLVASAVFVIKAGNDFRVISLPAGDYSWSGIYLDNLYSEFQEKMNFTVKAGKVSYIGDLLIHIDVASKKYRLEVRDNSSAAKLNLTQQYPNLSKAYPFTTSLTIDSRQEDQTGKILAK